MGFTHEELAAYADATVPDLLGDGAWQCRLLIVGINPGLWTAATGAHFARPGNRFYPALARAGIVSRTFDATAGMNDADRRELLDRGVGITNLAPRATAKADELTGAELRAGGERLNALVERLHPTVVAILGITAYRTAFGIRGAKQGRQPADLHGAQLWVLPNPSGLNAHETVESLADVYRAAAAAAGIID